MTTLGSVLQILGLLIAPLGFIHFWATRGMVPESTLMAWELGCLFAGALLFLIGRRLARSER